MIGAPPLKGPPVDKQTDRFDRGWQGWFSQAQNILQSTQLYGALAYATPASNSTYQILDGYGGAILAPTGPLSQLTVALPPNPVDRQQTQFSSTQAVASLTVTSSKVVIGTPASLAANTGVVLAYNQASGTWFVTQQPTQASAPATGGGIPPGQSGGVPYYVNAAALGSSAPLAAGALVLGGGRGAPPRTPVGLGTATTVLHGSAGGLPAWGSVALTTDVSGVLPVTHGGTGQASYAVGDLLYASGTTALSRLADVAVNSVLLSGGLGVAPAWGSVNLTAAVSGILPLANGGTGQTTALAAFTALSPQTLKGDIVVDNGTNPIRLAVGANGQTLTADSAQAGGVRWSAYFGDTTAYPTVTPGVTDIIPLVQGGVQKTALFSSFASRGVLALTDAATILVDASAHDNFRVTLAGNRSLANPTGLLDGQLVNIRIAQDATGMRTLTYGTAYKFSGGTIPLLSTLPSTHDYLSCQYDATDGSLYCALSKAFA